MVHRSISLDNISYVVIEPLRVLFSAVSFLIDENLIDECLLDECT